MQYIDPEYIYIMISQLKDELDKLTQERLQDFPDDLDGLNFIRIRYSAKIEALTELLDE